jgi:hypothetical protein
LIVVGLDRDQASELFLLSFTRILLGGRNSNNDLLTLFVS